jgi:hypothetical protein
MIRSGYNPIFDVGEGLDFDSPICKMENADHNVLSIPSTPDHKSHFFLESLFVRQIDFVNYSQKIVHFLIETITT